MRVTVDLDYPSRLQLLKSYYNMANLGPVELSRSAGGKGYHLVLYRLPIRFDDSVELRRLYGDDLNRIDFDLQRKAKPKQVLYTRKEGVDIERLTEVDLLMDPFYSGPFTAGGIKR